MPYPIAAGEQVPATDFNEFAESNQVEVGQLGESIDGSTTPQAVAFMREYVQGEADTITDGAHTALGRVGTNPTRRATKIRLRTGLTSTQIKCFLARVGSTGGGDTIAIKIETDSGGSPSGSVITNGTSNTVSDAGFETVLQEFTFTFASPFTLAANTDYWIVLERGGGLSNTNYYFTATHSVDYGSFSGKYYNGSSWVASQPIAFILTPATGGGIRVMKLRTNYQGDLSVFGGFLKANGSDGQTHPVFVNGIVTGFTGLIAGQPYYGQDSAGTIGISLGTYETKVGVPISATQMRIERGHMEYIGSRAFVTYGASSSTLTGVALAAYNARHIHVSVNSRAIRLSRVGAASGALVNGVIGTGSSNLTTSVSWSGNAVTGTCTETANDNNAALSGTVYFYR